MWLKVTVRYIQVHLCQFPILYCVLASRGGIFTGMDLGIGLGGQKGVKGRVFFWDFYVVSILKGGDPPLDPPVRGEGGIFF